MTARDPVCGMQVDTDRAPDQQEHEGRTYYFCSRECKQKFGQDPSQFRE